jgi:cyclopropane fatty-acyl-phospholipid synthase-like methyltransferase
MLRSTFIMMAAIASGCIGLATGSVYAQAPGTHQHRFGDAEHWAKYFDDPKRDEWQKPHEVIQALGLAPGAKVADIGSGTGYFSVRLAHFVPKGRVYAVDTEPGMVKYLADRAKREGLGNVTSVAGQAADPRLPEQVDLILMVDVFHHLSNRDQYFRKLRSSLTPGGRIALIDFNEKSPMGPPLAERIAPSRVRTEMSRAGYTLEAEHTFLPDQYFLVFRLTTPN